MLNKIKNWLKNLRSDAKPDEKIVLVKRSPSHTKKLRKIYPPNEHISLIESIRGNEPDQHNEGQNTQKSDNFNVLCNEYKDFVEYIYNNSDGIKIPLNKELLEKFDLSRRKLQSYKKQMILDDQLILSTPTTQVLNLNYDWDNYFML
jgi:hypothetical protein